MYKKVSSVIASAKMRIRTPAGNKMPDDNWRLLLHNALEMYHTFAIKENKDFYTHELDATLTYVTEQLGFTTTVEVADSQVSEYYPIALLYQDLASDPDTDSWMCIRIVKYNHFLAESGRGRPLATFIGNEWQGIHNAVMKLNLTEEWTSTHRFRMAFRFFPSAVLGFNDDVPFPQEHTTLLELNMAREALDLTEDNSPDWDKFYNRRVQTLETRLKEAEQSFSEWLLNDVENVVIIDTPYHYAYNNKLRTGLSRRHRPNWS